MKEITPIKDNQSAYVQMREYFSQPDAVLAKSTSRTPSCLYRLDKVADSPACVAGCLIPNELYNPRFEGVGSVYELMEEESTISDLFSNLDCIFLEGAQELHDQRARNAAHLIDLLDNFAGSEEGARFGLRRVETTA